MTHRMLTPAKGNRMSQGRKYPVRASIRQASALLDISVARVLSRSGLACDFFEGPERYVSAATVFRLWRAVEAEAGSAERLILAAAEAARGPFMPALLAFSCSPNIATGTERLALLKPLVGPFDMTCQMGAGGFTLICDSADPGLTLPPVVAAVEAVFLLSCARAFSGHPVLPLDIRMPDPSLVTPRIATLLGLVPRPGPRLSLTISAEDALRPLISEDTAFWTMIKGELHSRLASSEAAGTRLTLTERLGHVLEDLLPGGQVSVAAAAGRLGLSERSLQRRLKAEGTSFQAELDAQRLRLARLYLARGDLSTEEISYLLAFRDPNSFYRAFQAWTGMTPARARAALSGPAIPAD